LLLRPIGIKQDIQTKFSVEIQRLLNNCSMNAIVDFTRSGITTVWPWCGLNNDLQNTVDRQRFPVWGVVTATISQTVIFKQWNGSRFCDASKWQPPCADYNAQTRL